MIKIFKYFLLTCPFQLLMIQHMFKKTQPKKPTLTFTRVLLKNGVALHFLFFNLCGKTRGLRQLFSFITQNKNPKAMPIRNIRSTLGTMEIPTTLRDGDSYIINNKVLLIIMPWKHSVTSLVYIWKEVRVHCTACGRQCFPTYKWASRTLNVTRKGEAFRSASTNH